MENISEPNNNIKQESDFHLNKNKLVLVIISVILVIILAFAIISIFSKQTSNLQGKKRLSINTQKDFLSKPRDFILAKVGEENIYKSYFDTEYSVYPKSESSFTTIKKTITDKLVQDSIVLQEGNKEKLVVLTNSIYNSPTLVYSERIAAVQKIKDLLNNQTDKISGSVITIWFNNLNPAPMGYEKGKAFAFQKITQLHTSVANREMTMQQAGENIRNDLQLSFVDPSYKVNAFFAFKDFSQKNQITFDSKFNNIIWNLKVGEISDIYLAKDRPAGKTEKIDAVYMFAQVDKKTSDGKIISFNDWLKNSQKTYEITYY